MFKMQSEISSGEMEKCIESACDSSPVFQIFFRTEIPKLHGKKIQWIHDPSMKMDGLAAPVFNNGTTPSGYKIKIKNFPSFDGENQNFVIAHELAHCIQYEKGCLLVQFHRNFVQKIGSDSIPSAFNSMIYDYSVNQTLSRYGFKTPFYCKKLETSTDFFDKGNIGSIIFYVLTKNLSNFVDDEWDKEKVLIFNESIKDNSIGSVIYEGDEILSLLGKWNILCSVDDLSPDHVYCFLENLIERWNQKNTCKLRITKNHSYYFISLDE